MMMSELFDEIHKTYAEPDYSTVDDEQRAEGIRCYIQNILKRYSEETRKEFRDTIERDKFEIKFWHEVTLLSSEANEILRERKRRSFYFEDWEGNIYVYGEKIPHDELQKIS